MKRLLASLFTFIVVGTPCVAQSGSFFHLNDVATDLSGSTFMPSEIVRFDVTTSNYALAEALPENPPVDALHRLANGDWLLSTRIPTDLGGVTYDSRDVIRFDGAIYSLELDGVAAGIPTGSNVDALAMDGADLILGFNVPTTLGGTTYLRNDLVRHSGGVFTLFFDGLAAGVPGTSDVIGADLDGTDTLLAFDIATDLGGATYLPGQLVAWDGAVFTSFHDDPTWPRTSVLHSFALDGGGGGAGPGTIPATLEIARAGNDLQLTWGSSCSGTAADYAIYEGEIGNWYSHTSLDCSDDGGDLTETVTPSAGNRYYIVVPLDGGPNEGSYGTDGFVERPVGTSTCAVQIASGC